MCAGQSAIGVFESSSWPRHLRGVHSQSFTSRSRFRNRALLIAGFGWIIAAWASLIFPITPDNPCPMPTADTGLRTMEKGTSNNTRFRRFLLRRASGCSARVKVSLRSGTVLTAWTPIRKCAPEPVREAPERPLGVSRKLCITPSS